MCFWMARVGGWPEALLMIFGFAFIYVCFIHRIFFTFNYIFTCLFCPFGVFALGHTCAVSVAVRSHLVGISSPLWPYVSQGSN